MANPRPGLPRKDPAWLEYVESLRCTICGSQWQIKPHHCRHIRGRGGKALKPHDCLTVPLCPSCHARIHTGFREGEEAALNERLVYLLMEYLDTALSDEERF